jgi:hypothetical protein
MKSAIQPLVLYKVFLCLDEVHHSEAHHHQAKKYPYLSMGRNSQHACIGLRLLTGAYPVMIYTNSVVRFLLLGYYR